MRSRSEYDRGSVTRAAAGAWQSGVSNAVGGVPGSVTSAAVGAGWTVVSDAAGGAGAPVTVERGLVDGWTPGCWKECGKPATTWDHEESVETVESPWWRAGEADAKGGEGGGEVAAAGGAGAAV